MFQAFYIGLLFALISLSHLCAAEENQNPSQNTMMAQNQEGAARTSISSNPTAVNIETGTGALGEVLGIKKESGVRLGGLWIGDVN